MTPISKVPKELLDLPLTTSEELEQVRKELEELHNSRRPFIGIGQEKVYLDEDDGYYQNLTEEQVQFLRGRALISKSICELCGEHGAEHYNKEVTYKYKGEELALMQPGTWCSTCNDGVLEGSGLEATEDVLSKFRSEVDNGRS